jgi:lipopolysaccharide export system permease protein
MKILARYVTRQATVTLLITLGVFTSVLLMGRMMRQMSDMLMNQQVGLKAVGWFVLLVTPYVLSFTLPMAMLAMALLVFGRLSADNELTAMRASGIGLGQVVAPVLLLATLATGFCLYINTYLYPQCRAEFRERFVRLGAENPAALLEEGTYLRNFPGLVIYIARKKENILEDVTVYTLADDGKVMSSLRAQKGIVSAQPDTMKLTLDLYNVRGDLRDPKEPTNVRKIHPGTSARRYPLELDLATAMRKAQKSKDLRDMVFSELRAEIRALREKGIHPAAVLMEAHFRVSLAVACLAFTLIGIPLGIKTSRRETSIGIAISLGLALCFYLVAVLATTLKSQPQLYPELILWSPILVFELVGLWLLWRVTRV